MITALSNTIIKFERKFVAFLALVITLLALLNVVTRALHSALFWVDELLIYTMVWMVLIGSSVMVRNKSGIATTFFVDIFGQRLQKRFACLVDIVIFCFAIVFTLLCWRWYDLPALIRVGFDTQAFATTSFNYIYQEPTTTLGIPKYLIWLVMPLVALTLLIHSAANLIETLPKRQR